ncbi:MAG: hypothetical protein LC799_25790, partial [Actinobacteria bacterium]|nr:hypothetical protein [Actinomycetota bacterium]
TRALSCGKQSLFALVWFRERRDVALTGKGLGISQATSYRYLTPEVAQPATPTAEPAPTTQYPRS